MKIGTPLNKVAPLFPSNPPLKVEVLSSHLFLKIWLGGGVHTMLACKKNQLDSSIHSEIRVPCPFLTTTIQELIFTSLNLDQLVKNQHSSAIYSCNTEDFRVSWRKRSHTHFWLCQPSNYYISLICITIKKINSIKFFMIYS